MERLIRIGKIKPLNSNDILNSRFGIGMEKLDRDCFNPSKVYDKLQKLGVKYVRLQSGWEKTEKEKRKYDFDWLDQIVDNLISRGMIPWICLCYGNKLYSPEAKEYFGSVGIPPIYSQEEKDGWENYCKAIAKHFDKRVSMYEVWNEPDGSWCWKHGVNGKEYGNFVIDTSRAIKGVKKDAYIIGGSISGRDSVSFFEAMLQTGCYKYIDAVSYHLYSKTENRVINSYDNFRAILDKYDSNIDLIQGEEGCPSTSKGHGALCKGLWSEEKQAKILLSRMFMNLSTDLKFYSWFSSVDMIEALNGKCNDLASYLDYGYFGVLGAEFDDKGHSIGEYREKPSYFAYQNLISFFGKNGAKFCKLPVLPQHDKYTERVFGLPTQLEDVVINSFKKDNGSKAIGYYKPTDVITTSFQGVTSLVIDLPISDLKLVDLMDGSIYKIPDEMIEDLGNGVYKLHDIPIKDYPLFLTFGGFIENE